MCRPVTSEYPGHPRQGATLGTVSCVRRESVTRAYYMLFIVLSAGRGTRPTTPNLERFTRHTELSAERGVR